MHFSIVLCELNYWYQFYWDGIMLDSLTYLLPSFIMILWHVRNDVPTNVNAYKHKTQTECLKIFLILYEIWNINKY